MKNTSNKLYECTICKRKLYRKDVNIIEIDNYGNKLIICKDCKDKINIAYS